MNILYLDTPIEPPGGGQFSLLLMAKNSAFEKTVFLPYDCSFTGLLKERGINFKIVKINELFGEIKRVGPDLIHCNSASTRYSFAGALSARILGIPFLWHNRVAEKGGWKEKVIAALSSKILVISDEVRAKFFAFNNKTLKIFNAVDAEIFRPGIDVSGLKKELNLGPGRRVVGVFSRLDKWKGHEFLFESLAAVFKEKAEDAVLLVVGDGPEKEKLKKKAAQLEMSDKIIFLGHRQDIPALMNLCEVVFSPSVKPEGFGRVVIEAMACGRPVIASAIGGHLEIIEDGKDGILEELKSEKWKNSFLKLFMDSPLRDEISKKARLKVLEKFSAETHYSALMKVYKDMIKT